MLSRKATNTKFIFFGLTWPRLKPTQSTTRGEHTNYYTTVEVDEILAPSVPYNKYWLQTCFSKFPSLLSICVSKLINKVNEIQSFSISRCYIIECTETCKKYSVTVIFYYIFHIKPHFCKTLLQSRLLFDFDDCFTNKGRIKCSFTL